MKRLYLIRPKINWAAGKLGTGKGFIRRKSVLDITGRTSKYQATVLDKPQEYMAKNCDVLYSN